MGGRMKRFALFSEVLILMMILGVAFCAAVGRPFPGLAAGVISTLLALGVTRAVYGERN